MTQPSPGPSRPDREFLLSYERLYGEWLRAEQAATEAEADPSAESEAAPRAGNLRLLALEKLAALLRAVRESPL